MRTWMQYNACHFIERYKNKSNKNECIKQV